MIRLFSVSALVALLLPIGCGGEEEVSFPPPSDPAPAPTDLAPPSLEPLQVADWPPFGPDSRIDASCSDDVGLASISADFKFAKATRASGRSRDVSFIGSELGEGQGPLRIVCCDANRACVEREIANFLVDLTPPQIEGDRLVASPSGEGFDGDISVWVRDAWVLGSVELSFRGKTLRHEFPKAYPSTVGTEWDVSRVTFPAKDLPLGGGTATVIVRDAAGNSTLREVDLRVDGTAPTVSILEPTPGVVASGSSFVVKVTSSDEDNPTPTQIDLWIGGARVAELTGPTAELTVDTSTLPPGPTEIRAIARDDAGNESTAAKVVVQITAGP